MARFLIAALVVVSAALGLLMDNAWLLGGAVAFLAVALLVLIFLASRRRSRRAERERALDQSRSREQELRELGISDVRPRAGSSAERRRSAPRPESVPPAIVATVADEPEVDDDVNDAESEAEVEAEPDITEELAGGAAATPDAGPLPEREPEFREDRPMLQAADDHPIWQTHSPTAFASFLRACWAAVEAQTALLATVEHDGTYSLLAIRSHSPSVRKEGRFPADSFLHLAPTERPLTVLEGNDPLARELPYYRGASHIGAVAILPISSPQGTVYLAVDLRPDQPAFTERQRKLLLGFADLLETLLHHPPEEVPARVVPTRRAIISEEMARARNDNRPLSLALVYRIDAESISTGGENAVAAAERDLRLLLEDLVHHGRLERFGELMYGAFLHDERPAVEQWAERAQHRAVEEGFEVAVGVARMRDQVDADAFRADAANALAEALTTEDRFAFIESRAG